MADVRDWGGRFVDRRCRGSRCCRDPAGTGHRRRVRGRAGTRRGRARACSPARSTRPSSPSGACRWPSQRPACPSTRGAARSAGCTCRSRRMKRPSWCAAWRATVHDVVVDLRAGLADSARVAGARALGPAPQRGVRAAWLRPRLSDTRGRMRARVPDLHPLRPAAAAGVRWDDPAVAIEWPAEPTVISPRDAAFPPLDVARVRREGPTGLAAAEEASA